MKQRYFAILLLLSLLLTLCASCAAQDPTAREALPEERPETTYGTLRWPNNEWTASLPPPDSVRGEVAWNDESGIGIYVADLTAEDFRAYAEECMRGGYSVRYHLEDVSFEAWNASAYHLLLDYNADGVMLIRLEAPQALPETVPADLSDAPTGEASVETESTEAERNLPAEEETQEASADTEAASQERGSPSGTETEAASTENEGQTVTYVLNTNTMKFHLPTCASVAEIKEKNRQDYYGDRDALLAQGYTPCKRCNP